MSQSRSTPYYQELFAANREAQALKAQATEAKYARARALLADGVTIKDVAARLGLSDHTVREIRQGKR